MDMSGLPAGAIETPPGWEAASISIEDRILTLANGEDVPLDRVHYTETGLPLEGLVPETYTGRLAWLAGPTSRGTWIVGEVDIIDGH